MQIPNQGAKWIIVSSTQLDYSTEGVMNNQLTVVNSSQDRITRCTTLYGGGCLNFMIVNPGVTVKLSSYASSGSGNVTGILDAFNI